MDPVRRRFRGTPCAATGAHGTLRAMDTPTLLGSYRIERALGSGPAGCVYRARSEVAGELVAVKVMPLPPDADPVAGTRTRDAFEQEISTLRRIEPDGTVPILASGRLDGGVWLASPLRFEPSLDEVLEEGALPPAAVAELVDGLAATLDHCHGHDIVHRSLKPENVFVTARGALLTDFAFPGRASRAYLQGEPAAGRVSHAAPEQVLGYCQTPASNQYALAVLALRALTGRLPFDPSDTIEYLHGTVYREPDLSGLGEALQDVLSRALAKKPDARFRSCSVLAEAFAAALAPRLRLASPAEPEPADLMLTTRPHNVPLFDAAELAGPGFRDESTTRRLRLVPRLEEPSVGRLSPPPPDDPPPGPDRDPLEAIRCEPLREAPGEEPSLPPLPPVRRPGLPEGRSWLGRLGVRMSRWLRERPFFRDIHAAYLQDWRQQAVDDSGRQRESVSPMVPTWTFRVEHGAPDAWVWVDGRVQGPIPADLEIRGRAGDRVRLEVRARGRVLAETSIVLHPMMDTTWDAERA